VVLVLDLKEFRSGRQVDQRLSHSVIDEIIEKMNDGRSIKIYGLETLSARTLAGYLKNGEKKERKIIYCKSISSFPVNS